MFYLAKVVEAMFYICVPAALPLTFHTNYQVVAVMSNAAMFTSQTI